MLEILAGIAFIALFGSAAIKGANEVESKVIRNQDSFTKWDDNFIHNIGQKYWVLMKAICMNESSLGEAPSVKYGIENPSDIEGSKSEDGKSWGLMQMTVPTAKDYDSTASAVKLNDPLYSISIASKHILRLARIFNGVEEYIVKAYNQGEGNTKKEIDGEGGYADSYWDRYQRNKKIVMDGIGN